MKKFICLIFLILCCASCSNTLTSNTSPRLMRSSPNPISNNDKIMPTKSNDKNYSPLNYDHQEAVWISYIDLQPMLLNKTQQQFSENISSAYEKIKNLGCNTVYVHVRAFGDAYYKSNFYPYTKDISGEIGIDPTFDPLKIMVEEAHKLKLSFHAWINPMRCETEKNMEKINDKCVLKQWYNDTEKYNEYMQKSDSDNHYWLNPAIDDVRKLISDGVAEIVKNYNVDGIHIDDYFYPTTDESFDSDIYNKDGKDRSLSDFRKDNASKMVKDIYNSVKSENKDVLFGVSPQGNMENNYDFMYADVKKWCSEQGYLDYIVPQIYFGYKNTAKPFEQTAKDWSSIVTNKNVKLVIGLGMYKIGEEDEFSQNEGIIAEQIETSKKLNNYGGVALYNYINLFEPSDDLAQRTNAELKHIQSSLEK